MVATNALFSSQNHTLIKPQHPSASRERHVVRDGSSARPTTTQVTTTAAHNISAGMMNGVVSSSGSRRSSISRQSAVAPGVPLTEIDGKKTREVVGKEIIERNTKVLWDQKRIISPSELTPEHLVTKVDVSEKQVKHPKTIIVEETVNRKVKTQEVRRY